MHSRKPPLQEVKAPPFVESPNEVRVLTFNLGLLRITAAGVELKGAPPHVSERFAYIPAAIAAVGADIIFLQEIYEPDHVARLRAALPQYPHFARRDNQRFWQFHNGLLVLSKFPIDFWVLKKHKECSALERNFACKSCLATYITTPAGKLCFVNMHTTAGGGVDPESDGVDAGREAELAEAMAMCAEAAKEGYAGAVVGDLNMGPEASKPNYDYMGAQGWTDALLPFAETIGCTWDPKSPLNNMPVFAKCPPQRIDHIFFSQGAPFEVTEARRRFDDACVKAGKHMVTISDHFGISATIRAKRTEEGL